MVRILDAVRDEVVMELPLIVDAIRVDTPTVPTSIVDTTRLDACSCTVERLDACSEEVRMELA